MPDRFDTWLKGLDEADRAYYATKISEWTSDQRTRGVELANTLQKMKCQDPEGWAFSEVSEDKAQMLRYAFLLGITKEIEHNAKVGVDGLESEDPLVTAAIEKFQRSLSEAERRAFLAAFGKQLADDIVHMIDQGCSSNLIEPGTVWALVELDEQYSPTSRDLGGLHESANELDFYPKV